MLATGRYLYVVFFCHLALEKMLKAHVVEVTQSIPARTHDLIYLVKKSELSLPSRIWNSSAKSITSALSHGILKTCSARYAIILNRLHVII